MASERSDRAALPVSRLEFEAALRASERLLTAADAHAAAAARYLALAAGAVLASILLVGAAVVDASGVVAPIAFAVATAAADSVFVGYLLRVAVTPRRKAAARDERYAVETVSTLRELLPVLSSDEQWSRFQVEQARLRMSRFGIGPRRQR